MPTKAQIEALSPLQRTVLLNLLVDVIKAKDGLKPSQLHAIFIDALGTP